MEDSMLGFDRHGVGQKFERAGEIRLEMTEDGLQISDGSHPEASSAVKMSKERGVNVAENLKQRVRRQRCEVRSIDL